MRTGKPPSKPIRNASARGTKQAAAREDNERRRKGARVTDILGGNSVPPLSPTRVPAKWRWHYHTLLSLQSHLLEERGELRNAIAEPLEPHSLNEADSATDEFDHDLALTRLSVEEDALCEINEALKRILSRSYGVCEETGRAIPSARLKAIPWTRFTREAEERLEQDGVATRARLNKPDTVRGKGRVWLAAEEEAEETGENSPALPNDEALSNVFSPPGLPGPRQKSSRHSPNSAKQKGRTK